MQHQSSRQSNSSHQMNNSHMDRSHQSSSAGSEARRAYLASMHRRRPPPSFRPYMIIILVLAVGLLLIGLTMTIIGVWPSYSPSGGNPLLIVGPIMLGIGLIGLIGMIANICYKKEKEKEAILQSISDMRSSRMSLPSQHSVRTATPSMHAKPTKSILKASSTSTYNGTAKGSAGEYESDSGMANTHSFSTNRSYERDSDMSDNSRGLDNIKVEMMPDPTAYRHGKPVDQSSTGSDQGVPPASMSGPRYQNQQQQRPPSQSRPSYSNQGYQADARETDIDGDLRGSGSRHMQDYSRSGGFDMYDRSSAEGQASLTGGGALGSAYSSPVAPVPQQPQQRQRWGSKSPRTSAGQANQAYHSDQPVAVVSDMYQQAAVSYTTPTKGHYTSYAHSEGAAQPAQHIPSSSTEV